MEYPRSNDAAWTMKIHRFLYWMRVLKVGWKVVGVFGVLGIAVLWGGVGG